MDPPRAWVGRAEQGSGLVANVVGDPEDRQLGSAHSAVVRAGAPRRALTSRLSAGHLTMIVAGLLGALLSLAVLRASDHRVEVAVAARDIPPGSRVTRDSFRFTRVAMDAEVLSTMVRASDVSSLEGDIASIRIRAGNPITRAVLLRAAAPHRLRSVGIPVAPDHAVGGDVGAGDRIDVLSTDGERSGLVVANLSVLDVKRQRGALGSGDEKLTVVVALDADEATRLAPALDGNKFVIVLATGADPITGLAPSPTASAGPAVRGSNGG